MKAIIPIFERVADNFDMFCCLLLFLSFENRDEDDAAESPLTMVSPISVPCVVDVRTEGLVPPLWTNFVVLIPVADVGIGRVNPLTVKKHNKKDAATSLELLLMANTDIARLRSHLFPFVVVALRL